MSAPAIPGNLNTKFKEDGTISANTNQNKYTLFDLEKRVIDSLNDFNTKMATLIRCTNTYTAIPGEPNWNIQYAGKKGCESIPNNQNVSVMEDKLVESYNDLEDKIDAMNTAISNMNKNPPGINNEEYNNTYSSIVNKHAEIVKMQKDISQKLKDIQILDKNPQYKKESNTSYVDDYQTKYSRTMYSTAMLTILATSLAYYAFLKL